jgi:hypothetical protein
MGAVIYFRVFNEYNISAWKSYPQAALTRIVEAFKLGTI